MKTNVPNSVENKPTPPSNTNTEDKDKSNDIILAVQENPIIEDINKNSFFDNVSNNRLDSEINKDVSFIQSQTSDDPETLEKINNTIYYWKIFVVVFIISCMIATVIFYNDLKSLFILFMAFLKKNVLLGSFILILVKIIGTILYVPGILLAVASGYGFKQVFDSYLLSVPIGVIVMMTGSILGCCCVFFLSRLLLQGWLYPTLRKLKLFRALDRAIVKKGIKVNLLLRLSPVIPYNVMNYFLGITNTSFKDYLIGLSGFIPLVICYVYLGSTIDDLAQYSFKKSEKQEIIILILSILISVVCIIYLTFIAKAELDLELVNEEKLVDKVNKEIMKDEECCSGKRSL